MSAYDNVRRDEHSTMGDAMDRLKRDEDAFTAGVQYALDRVLNRTPDLNGMGRYLDTLAADLLGSVHRGELL